MENLTLTLEFVWTMKRVLIIWIYKFTTHYRTASKQCVTLKLYRSGCGYCSWYLLLNYIAIWLMKIKPSTRNNNWHWRSGIL